MILEMDYKYVMTGLQLKWFSTDLILTLIIQILTMILKHRNPNQSSQIGALIFPDIHKSQ